MLGVGKVTVEAAPFKSGARLYAGNKKQGGIRPTAVGEIIRRLVSKCFAFMSSNNAVKILAPLQTGFRVWGGCEALIHSIRALLSDASIPSE